MIKSNRICAVSSNQLESDVNPLNISPSRNWNGPKRIRISKSAFNKFIEITRLFSCNYDSKRTTFIVEHILWLMTTVRHVHMHVCESSSCDNGEHCAEWWWIVSVSNNMRWIKSRWSHHQRCTVLATTTGSTSTTLPLPPTSTTAANSFYFNKFTVCDACTREICK